MATASDGKARVVIAGGGVAALEATLALRELAHDRVDIELVAPEPHFWYRPLSVAAPFRLGEVRHFELSGLARQLGAEFTPGALVAVDTRRRVASTSAGVELPYDALLVACGAIPESAIPGATTFRGPADVEKIESLVDEVAAGTVRSVVFAVPWGAVWSLPAYELALLTAAHLDAQGVEDIALTIVTPEGRPLEIFGTAASDALEASLAERDIALRSGTYAREATAGELLLVPDGSIPADRVIALPRLRGVPIEGLPQTVHGFVPVDAHCRVDGLEDVYAAGDITSFTIKQGGIAAQQADAAAETIAEAVGADVVATRFRPVLRGLLLTGAQPRYLRRELGALPEREPAASYEPLWWPPAKVVGRHLAPFLASLEGVEQPPELPEGAPQTVLVERELDREAHVGLEPDELLQLAGTAAGMRAMDLMSPDPVSVAPDESLAEVAEKLVRHDQRAAVVMEGERLLGIVTATDIVRVMAMRVRADDVHVRHYMTVDPVIVPLSAPADAAQLLMEQYGIGQVLVGDDGAPVGVLDRDTVEQAAPVVVAAG